MEIQQLIELDNQEIIDKGYFWFNENILPYKDKFTKQTDLYIKEKYFLLLDDMIDTINSANYAYKIVLVVNENNIDTHKKIAEMYENLGQYELAKEFYLKAYNIVEDKNIIQNIKELDVQITEKTPPHYYSKNKNILVSDFIF